ncbi:MAG: hypothetical protein PHG91_04755 [Syntrophales bacterium]|jgi:hypothetical protein|nr:hypothetical protein [Syntrophales bacterium]MDD5232686.1 hypothetical protein [Syntrophales bacterium]HPL63217.1 hypothetical protein [Syntrophales bacterium]
MKAYGIKLIELTKQHAEAIARQWYNNVKMNPKTPSYRRLPEERALRHAVYFYQNLHKLFFTDTPFEEAGKFFTRYAEDRYAEGLSLTETVYALVLMRRHMWLFAEFQASFVTAVEHHQATESLSRTILMFDYAVYVITNRYEELLRAEIEDKLKSMKVKMPAGFLRALQPRPGTTQERSLA